MEASQSLCHFLAIRNEQWVERRELEFLPQETLESGKNMNWIKNRCPCVPSTGEMQKEARSCERFNFIRRTAIRLSAWSINLNCYVMAQRSIKQTQLSFYASTLSVHQKMWIQSILTLNGTQVHLKRAEAANIRLNQRWTHEGNAFARGDETVISNAELRLLLACKLALPPFNTGNWASSKTCLVPCRCPFSP